MTDRIKGGAVPHYKRAVKRGIPQGRAHPFVADDSRGFRPKPPRSYGPPLHPDHDPNSPPTQTPTQPPRIPPPEREDVAGVVGVGADLFGSVSLPGMPVRDDKGFVVENLRLTKGNNVLSWDCGTKNLSYCLMEDTCESGATEQEREAGFKIHAWSRINLETSDYRHVPGALMTQLDSRPWMLRVDEVVIEAQIPDNTLMKTISHLIQMYFLMRSVPLQSSLERYNHLSRSIHSRRRMAIPVEFIRAGAKFERLPAEVTRMMDNLDEHDQQDGGAESDAGAAGGGADDIEEAVTNGMAAPSISVSKRKRRKHKPFGDRRTNAKRKAVKACTCLLRISYGSDSDEMVHLLRNNDKPDDLCDSMLQAYYILMVRRTRRKIRNSFRTIIVANVDDDKDGSDKPVFPPPGFPDNESVLRLEDRDLDSHQVFEGHGFRDVAVDIENSVIETALRIDRLLFTGVEFTGGSEDKIV